MTHQRNRSVRKRKSMRGGQTPAAPIGGRKRRSMRGGREITACTTCGGGRRRSNRRSMRGGQDLLGSPIAG